MTAVREIPTVDQYWETLAPHLRSFSPEEQRASVVQDCRGRLRAD